MNCLWCDEEIIPQISWENLFFLSRPSNLCDMCKDELEILHGKRCTVCSRMSELTICADCSWWDNYAKGQDPLTFNYSIFSYNDRMQEMVARWKYRGDYILGNAFQDILRHSFVKKFSSIAKDAFVVPIPLSSERQEERGFNQAEVLADFLPIEKKLVLERIHGEKQSKKSRRERIATENPFELRQNIHKPVILVDDIYTTGTTLRHAAKLLKQRGCPKVYAYTLIRG